jgi:SAM-dependent methyltransferase
MNNSMMKYKRGQPRGVWPKTLPSLTPEQQRIRDDFVGIWLDALPQRYELIEHFNHRYPQRHLNTTQIYRTLDIGAGRGEHLEYEELNHQEYTALELRQELAVKIQTKFPDVKTCVGDIQQRLDYTDGYFDRILAIHVLEHLPDLPRALDEIQRLLDLAGSFCVLIPCDPGFAYEIARRISAQRIFEHRYKQSYDWFMASEHINSPQEIIAELQKRFVIQHQTFFPLLIPIIHLNLVIGLTLTHHPIADPMGK